MDIHSPSKKVCEEFNLTYEMKGAQKALDLLANYYELRRMKIVLNGRKVGNGYEACYYKNVAYFKKRGLNKTHVLHEFLHHIVYVQKLEMSESKEERIANLFAKEVVRRHIRIRKCLKNPKSKRKKKRIGGTRGLKLLSNSDPIKTIQKLMCVSIL